MSGAKRPPAKRWGHDLTTMEGSTAFERDYNDRKRVAEDFHATTFLDIRYNLDEIDRLIISVLTDLSYDDEMSQTAFEVAKIARAAFCIRGVLPREHDEDDEEKSDVRASEKAEVAS